MPVQKLAAPKISRHIRSLLLSLGLMLILPIGFGQAVAGEPIAIAVLPLELDDNSREGEKRVNHTPMLADTTKLIRQQIGTIGHFANVPGADVDAAVKEVDSSTHLRQCNGCEFDIARKVGADKVMIGWLFKVSTLISTLHIHIKDVKTERLIYARPFNFRGDNQRAWTRAAKFMIKKLKRDFDGTRQ